MSSGAHLVIQPTGLACRVAATSSQACKATRPCHHPATQSAKGRVWYTPHARPLLLSALSACAPRQLHWHAGPTRALMCLQLPSSRGGQHNKHYPTPVTINTHQHSRLETANTAEVAWLCHHIASQRIQGEVAFGHSHLQELEQMQNDRYSACRLKDDECRHRLPPELQWVRGLLHSIGGHARCLATSSSALTA